MTTARRALEAHARRDAEVATTHQAQPVGPEHDTAAQQAGSPMDGETGFRRCFLWPQRLRGLPLVRVSPLPDVEATHRAFRGLVGKLLRARPHGACERSGPLGDLAIGDALSLEARTFVNRAAFDEDAFHYINGVFRVS